MRQDYCQHWIVLGDVSRPKHLWTTFVCMIQVASRVKTSLLGFEPIIWLSDVKRVNRLCWFLAWTIWVLSEQKSMVWISQGPGKRFRTSLLKNRNSAAIWSEMHR